MGVISDIHVMDFGPSGLPLQPGVIMNINKILYTLLITDVPRIRGKGWTEYTAQDRNMLRLKAKAKVKNKKRGK